MAYKDGSMSGWPKRWDEYIAYHQYSGPVFDLIFYRMTTWDSVMGVGNSLMAAGNVVRLPGMAVWSTQTTAWPKGVAA